MGAYLSQPITEKETEEGKNALLEYAVAAMQGWRTEMEDAHVCALDVDEETSVFGVFDGHGGREVAKFVALHLVEELLATHGFKKANMAVGLKEAYLSLDARIRSDKSRSELLKLSSAVKTEEEQSLERVINVDNLPHLLREAIGATNSDRRRGDEIQDGSDSEYSELEIENGMEISSSASEEEEEDHGYRVASFPIVLSDSSSSSGGSNCSSESDNEEPALEQEFQQEGEAKSSTVQPVSGQCTQGDQERVVVLEHVRRTEAEKETEVPNKISELFPMSDSTDSAECRSSVMGGAAVEEDRTPVSTDAPELSEKEAINASTDDKKIEAISDSCQVRSVDTNAHSYPPHEQKTREKRPSGSARSGLFSFLCPFPCLRTQASIPEEDAKISLSPGSDCAADLFSENPLAPKKDTTADAWESMPNGTTEPSQSAAADALDTDEEHSEAVQEERPAEIIPDPQLEPEDVNGRDVTVAGCTAVVAIIREATLYVANAGDSRCVLCRDGAALAMSRDHKPNDPEEYARIRNAGGFVSDGRVNGCLNLSRALGDMEYKKTPNLGPEEFMITADPDVRSTALQGADQFLILACDGIWDVLSDQEACDFVISRLRKERSLKSIAAELCDFCLSDDAEGSGEGCDNMTAVIVSLNTYSSGSSSSQ